jgi:DNA-binding HxlR family transcriptional regulator
VRTDHERRAANQGARPQQERETGGPEAGLDAALARIGDRWSLLVVNALLDGAQRFNELQAGLGDIATNVLSQRLKSLERLGLVLATPYSERPRRFAYGLTAAGYELAGALRLLARWGADRAGAATEGPLHRRCGTPLEAQWYCPTCSRVLNDDERDDPGFI